MSTRRNRCGLLAMLIASGVVGSSTLAQDGKPAPAVPPAPATPGKAEAPKPEAPKPADEGKPAAPSTPAATSPPATEVKSDPYVLGFTMKLIDGTEQNLADYKGKVLLMVNVASKCGYTPQYEGLEKLYRLKKDQGFAVLAFPANNFRNQEPGTDKEIAQFCKDRYQVTFPVFSKISVAGSDQHPLYKKLTAQPKPIGGEIDWNFNKFLVDREGNVIARYGKHVKPDDSELVKAIDEALKPKDAAK